MTKSASKNHGAERDHAALNRIIAVFLIIQAVFLLWLLLYYHVRAGALALAAGAAWAAASLTLARLLTRARQPTAARQDEGAANNNILGRPGKNLDLAGICSLLKEGMALVRQGRIIYVNPALAYLLALQEEEILGTPISAYVHPEDAELVDLDGSGGPARSSLRLNTSLGDVRWVICSLHHVDWQGERSMLLLFENIGTLHQAREDTEKLEQQMRMLMEHSSLGIAMFDAMGQLKSSNAAWNSIWSSIVGNIGFRFNILQNQFLPHKVVKKAILQAFDKQDAYIANFEHIAPWGEARWLNLSFHPALDPMGRLIGVGMIQQDVTDQIRGARRENELNEQLSALRRKLVDKPL